MGKKLNYELLKPFLEELPTKLNLHKGRRSLWPQFIYHSTEVHDAVSILNSGYVYSRKSAMDLGLLEYDIASESVITSTRDEIKDYARFYFRPGTPTQYNNEGIRPMGKFGLDAHCPIPVYLLFDSLEVLSIETTRFSDGNLARFITNLVSSVEEFKGLPFELIYHVGYYSKLEGDKITNCRNAEVVVPDRLSTDFLRSIYCRSEAEKETLLSLMPAEISNIWRDHITVDLLGHLFYKKWTFINNVRSDDSNIILYFSPETETPGPFDVSIKLYDFDDKLIDSLNYVNIICNEKRKFSFRGSYSEYLIKIFLDDNLCYQGYHINNDFTF